MRTVGDCTRETYEFLKRNPAVRKATLQWNKGGHFADADVLKSEYFGCHPCINTSSIRLRTKDLMEKVITVLDHEPIIVDLGSMMGVSA